MPICTDCNDTGIKQNRTFPTCRTCSGRGISWRKYVPDIGGWRPCCGIPYLGTCGRCNGDGFNVRRLPAPCGDDCAYKLQQEKDREDKQRYTQKLERQMEEERRRAEEKRRRIEEERQKAEEERQRIEEERRKAEEKRKEMEEQAEKANKRAEEERQRAEESNRKLTEITELSECQVCFEQTIDCVFIPCGHAYTCMKCGENLTLCPVCRDECETMKMFNP